MMTCEKCGHVQLDPDLIARSGRSLVDIDRYRSSTKVTQFSIHPGTNKDCVNITVNRGESGWVVTERDCAIAYDMLLKAVLNG